MHQTIDSAIIAAVIAKFAVASAAPTQVQKAEMDICVRAEMCTLAVMAGAVEKEHMPSRVAAI